MWVVCHSNGIVLLWSPLNPQESMEQIQKDMDNSRVAELLVCARWPQFIIVAPGAPHRYCWINQFWLWPVYLGVYGLELKDRG